MALQNCVFKRSRSDGDEFEILVNKKTSITQSPKKFKVGEEDVLKIACAPQLGTLEELKDLCEHQQVSLTGKVQLLLAVEEVVVKSTGKRLSKQEFVFADCTAACRGVLWEEHINEVKENSCYNIINATVRSMGLSMCQLGKKP